MFEKHLVKRYFIILEGIIVQCHFVQNLEQQRIRVEQFLTFLHVEGVKCIVALH